MINKQWYLRELHLISLSSNFWKINPQYNGMKFNLDFMSKLAIISSTSDSNIFKVLTEVRFQFLPS